MVDQKTYVMAHENLWSLVCLLHVFDCVFLCFQKCSHPSVGGDCVLAVNRTGVHFLSHSAVSEETLACRVKVDFHRRVWMYTGLVLRT